MKTIDDIDRQILQILCKNSRITASELGASVGLTRQAVTDRIEKLRTSGVINQFTLALSPEHLGFSIRAYIAITILPGCSEQQEREVIALLEANPYVQECYRMTGEDFHQVRVLVPDSTALKELVNALRATQVVQSTRTLIALETLFEKGAMSYPLETILPETEADNANPR